ncbi:MAG TPA: hypothetical protein VJ946_08260, partial [Bacteroidales bacterium]|nr:hypothetical protein [Bacteroidales bacterium]
AEVNFNRLDENDPNALFKALVQSAFSGNEANAEMPGNLLDPLLGGMSLDSAMFDLDFFKGMQVEGEDLLQTFTRFASVMETVDDPLEKLSRRTEELGQTAEQAFQEMAAVVQVMSQVEATTKSLGRTETMENIAQLNRTWNDMLQTLVELSAPIEKINALEKSRLQVLGANISGLSAGSIQSAITSGGDIEKVIKKNISSIFAGFAAEKLYEDFGRDLNSKIGQAFNDGGINAVMEMMDDLDEEARDLVQGMSPIIDQIDALFDTVKTSVQEANLVVAEAVQGTLTSSQMFQKWGIQNAQAQALFSRMVQDTVTKNELEGAVSAFSELGLEGDQLTTIVNYLADAFVNASNELEDSLNGINDALSGLPTNQSDKEIARQNLESAFSNIINPPDVQTSSETEWVFDQAAYNEAMGQYGRSTWQDDISNIVDELYASIGRTNAPSVSKSAWESKAGGFNSAEAFANAFYEQTIEDISFFVPEQVAQTMSQFLTGGDYSGTIAPIASAIEALIGSFSWERPDAPSQTDFYTEQPVPGAITHITPAMRNVINTLSGFETDDIFDAPMEFFDTLRGMDENALDAIFGTDAEGLINQLTSAYNDYENAMDSTATSAGNTTSDITEKLQGQIDGFNSNVQDIINKNTMSDLEYELYSLSTWYDEQKQIAEELGISLGDLTKAYNLQVNAVREAAHEEEVDSARSKYIGALEKEQAILEDNLNTAKNAYLTKLDDELRAKQELVSETENTISSFDNLVDTLKDAKSALVMEAEMSPVRQSAFVEAQIAGAMGRIKSGDPAE